MTMADPMMAERYPPTQQDAWILQLIAADDLVSFAVGITAD